MEGSRCEEVLHDDITSPRIALPRTRLINGTALFERSRQSEIHGRKDSPIRLNNKPISEHPYNSSMYYTPQSHVCGLSNSVRILHASLPSCRSTRFRSLFTDSRLESKLTDIRMIFHKDVDHINSEYP